MSAALAVRAMVVAHVGARVVATPSGGALCQAVVDVLLHESTIAAAADEWAVPLHRLQWTVRRFRRRVARCDRELLAAAKAVFTTENTESTEEGGGGEVSRCLGVEVSRGGAKARMA